MRWFVILLISLMCIGFLGSCSDPEPKGDPITVDPNA
jgi:hypothetical protein